MEKLNFFRFAAAIIAAIVAAFTVSRVERLEKEGARDRFNSVIDPSMPVVIIPLLFLVSLWLEIFTDALVLYASFFTLAVFLCIYFTAAYFLDPLIRKHFTARAASIMWLVPAFMYFNILAGMQHKAPLAVIKIPFVSLKAVIMVWLAGFAASFLCDIALHIRLKKILLKDAEEAEDAEISRILEHGLSAVSMKKKHIKVMYSPAADSPVSFGLFRGRARILLPVKKYSETELSVIIRRELIHIKRWDCSVRLYEAFLTAMCWFFPPLRKYFRLLREEVERSCDDSLLRFATAEEKAAFSVLLDAEACEYGGFTTCVSRTEEAEEYRKEGLEESGDKRGGAIVYAVSIFLLLSLSGLACFSFDEQSISDAMGDAFENASIEELRFSPDYDFNGVSAWDEDRILEYVSSLRVCTLSDFYLEDYDNRLIFTGAADGKNYRVVLSDRRAVLWLEEDKNSASDSKVLTLCEKPDFKLIGSFITEDEPYPKTPEMQLKVSLGGKEDTNKIGFKVESITTPEETRHPDWDYDGKCIWHGILPDKDMEMSFSYEPDSIEVSRLPVFEGEFGEESLGDVRTLPLPGAELEGRSFKYVVKGRFTSTRKTTYEVASELIFVAPQDAERYDEMNK